MSVTHEPTDFQPLTPAVLHILMSLADGERHGYGIMQAVAIQSDNIITMGPGTLYGSIKRMLASGLIEESDERVDINRLAEDLGLEIDDLLPLIEAGSLLGFLQVGGGDVAMTLAGRHFMNAGILQQKEYFKEAALRHVPMLNQIVRALHTRGGQPVSDELFRDLLDEHFSEEEVQRQMDTIVTWGRYAELFEYDAGEKRFYLREPDPGHHHDAETKETGTGVAEG